MKAANTATVIRESIRDIKNLHLFGAYLLEYLIIENYIFMS